MQKNFAKKITLLFFVALFACKSSRENDPYILSLIPEIRDLEKQDHALCVSLKLNTDKPNNLDSYNYWRCRLTFAKYRVSTGQPSPQQAKRDLEISDLITKVSLKVNQVAEPFLVRESRKIDNRQHNKCLAMGYELYTEDQVKIDEYFSCRRGLIEDQQILPAYKNTDFLNYPNSEYTIGVAVDTRLDEASKKFQEAKNTYPTCVKFNLYSENYKRCISAQDNSRQCAKEIERKRFKREWEEKTFCQKQAYVRFPDELVKKEESLQEEIDHMNKKSDYYNQQNFASIGIDGTLFSGEVEQKEEVKKVTKKKKEEAKKLNTKVGLYRKFELTKLRQGYAIQCQQRANGDVEKYVAELVKECDDLTKFDIFE